MYPGYERGNNLKNIEVEMDRERRTHKHTETNTHPQQDH